MLEDFSALINGDPIEGFSLRQNWLREGEAEDLKAIYRLLSASRDGEGILRRAFEGILPAELFPYTGRLLEQGIFPECPDAILFSLYPPGISTGPHRDAPQYGETIAGLSLGETATMIFEHINGTRQRLTAHLPEGSLYIMRGEARHQYTHRTTPINGLRWSVTFRQLQPHMRMKKDVEWMRVH